MDNAALDKQFKQSVSRWLFYRDVRQVLLGLGLVAFVLALKVNPWFYTLCIVCVVGMIKTKILQTREVRLVVSQTLDSCAMRLIIEYPPDLENPIIYNGGFEEAP